MTPATEAAYTRQKVATLLLAEAFCDHGVDEEVRVYVSFNPTYSPSQSTGVSSCK